MIDIGAILSSKPIVYTGIFLGTAFVCLWVMSIYSVYRDIFARTQSTVLQVASLMVVILFPLIGLSMYNLLKPTMTLEERKLQLLEEKILRLEFDKMVKDRKGDRPPLEQQVKRHMISQGSHDVVQTNDESRLEP